ncbi:hypothetical protein DPM19_13505 [Actinomadura craniellae]|uniref:Galactose oxidase n=1 Tax=Actinomadura craniellae TaxID=2231787 RepID=A0A365H6L9_9ACTN|nr:hypothetical protein [Actinomadura craniellae]RAY14755.1 hypothetical protein DPM19_13505 [Actinomadura craniellae]
MELLQNQRITGAAMVLSTSGTAPAGFPDAPWRAVSPALPDAQYILNGVSARSATDAWAVGQRRNAPLLIHWNGVDWTPGTATPAPPELIGAGLQGVACAGAAAIAVGGGYDRLAGTETPLVRHWDGAGWTDPGPVGPGRGFVLTGVVLPAETEAWAVGHGAPGGNGSAGPVILRWSGGTWADARPPSLVPARTRGSLLAADAAAPDDVWAVGALDGPRRGARGALIAHYDGHAWRRVPCPTARPLTDVLALSATDAWAVGGDTVLHWNGRGWKRVRVPIGSANTVTGLSPHDIWVGGGHGELAHFDGARWTRVHTPQPLDDSTVWLAGTARAGTTWMVGSRRTTGHGPAQPHPTGSGRPGEAGG